MYPEDIAKKIGFDSVKELLLNHCLSDIGRKKVHAMKFSSDFNSVHYWLKQTQEFKNILTEDDEFPSSNYHDISGIFSKLKVEGLYLEEKDLFKIIQVYLLLKTIQDYFSKRKEKYPNLYKIFEHSQLNKIIPQSIQPVIDDEGRLKPSASPELLKLMQSIHKTEQGIHKTLVSIFKNAKKEGWAGETDISIREGRLVIPIIAEHKRKLKGLVHDESASGNIVYLEPVEIVEANNQLRHLYFERNREVERILRQVTTKLIPVLPDLEQYLKLISITDFIRAKALLSISLNGNLPLLNKESKLRLIQAFNPQLFILLKKSKNQLIPLNLELDIERRIMVISGPNAGGKSVALKTIAINQYMLQCGLLPCSSPDSDYGLFNTLLVDIGDGQSIDQNLSSYSAHLTAMKYFLNRCDSKTFFFIDELGSGTDPQFGGAIGEAVLEALNAKKGFGVVTTHFTNIKNYAEQNEGFTNGSMLYDLKHYKPLYTLVSGKPGSSFAIELATKTGLDKELIENAKKKIGVEHNNIEELINRYELDVKQTKDSLKRIERKEEVLQKLIKDYEELNEKLASQKSDIIRQAKLEALDILNRSNKLIEKSVMDIKNSSADLTKVRTSRNSIKELKTELEQSINIKDKSKDKTSAEKQKIIFEPGELVKIKGYETVGKILQIGKEKMLIELGLIKSRIDIDQVEKVKETKEKPKTKISGFNYHKVSEAFSPRLDVRGMLAEEAIQEVLKTVDNALVLNVDKLWVLHGKGNGILRKMIRENLKKIRHVKKIASEHPDFGGDGITILDLG